MHFHEFKGEGLQGGGRPEAVRLFPPVMSRNAGYKADLSPSECFIPLDAKDNSKVDEDISKKESEKLNKSLGGRTAKVQDVSI